MSAFEKIAAGLEDAIGFAEGTADPAEFRPHISSSIDVKSIRKHQHLSQEAFSAKYGLTPGRILDWEEN